MHTFLRDRFEFNALLLDIILIASSVVFCATTFVRDDVYVQLGLSPQTMGIVTGLASIAAFFASLVGLRVDWKGRSARHSDAVKKLSEVTALFAKYRLDNDTWAADKARELHDAYWAAMNNIIEIPAKSFVKLKAMHLRKVEMSRLLDSRPGAPIFLLWLTVRLKSVRKPSRGSHES